MNSKTWEMFESKELEFAQTQPDPFEYIAKLREINIVVDDSVADGVAEAWYKDDYEFHLEVNRIKAELAKKKGEA